ncbi:Svf1-like-domain-containing protein [Phellopilus nigrolimitatus]|nr:Svf1-like-domain-containing protein [Phellopilus nigrolimitatus]
MLKIAGFMLDEDDVLKLASGIVEREMDSTNAMLRILEEVEFKGKKAIHRSLYWPPGTHERKLCVIMRSRNDPKEHRRKYKEILPKKEDMIWLEWMVCWLECFVDVDPLADTIPPRYAYESDDEDELADFSVVGSSRGAPDVDVTIVLGDNREALGQVLIVANGEAGAVWGKGAKLGEQVGQVSVNKRAIGLVFKPSWAASPVIVSEALTRLPVWAMHAYAEAILGRWKPSRVVVIDAYSTATYISATPIPHHEAPLRYLQSGPVNADLPLSSPSLAPFAPPNLLQSTAAAFLSIIALPGSSPISKATPSALAILLPSPRVHKPAPHTFSSEADVDDVLPSWNSENAEFWDPAVAREGHRVLLSSVGCKDSAIKWQGETDKSGSAPVRRRVAEVEGSIAAPVDPNAPTFHPVSSRYPANELVGELEPKDLEWLCAGGFTTETQIYYNFLEDGTFVMCQVIHSSIGIWYPTVQFTFTMYNPTTKERVWRSSNVTNFVSPAPGLDKRSSKSDSFAITFKSKPGTDNPESFTIFAQVAEDVQITLEVTRPASAPGWKIGKGPKSGFSYYGPDVEKPEGSVFHSFWPRTQCSGHIIYKGQAIPANGPGMYVHAIMGMRPNLIASRWNFADFQSNEHGGVSAIQMELTTPDAYGLNGAGSGGVKVNFGSLVLGGKLVCVTAETTLPEEDKPAETQFVSRAFHHNTIIDSDTSHAQPKELEFVWSGPSTLSDAPGQVSASMKVDVGTPTQPKGLVEKVDVLAEIPAMLKAVVNYVAGTKPYIYQWTNPTTLKVTAPDTILPGASSGLDIEGYLYNEATFVS